MDLQGTTAVVTGGSSGLGAATADKLAARGARVFTLDRPGGDTGGTPQGVERIEADVADAEQVDAAFATVAATGLELRVVVSCAGIGHAERLHGRHGTHSAAAFSAVLATNLAGTFHVMNAGAHVMSSNVPGPDGQRGVIVNTASIAAYEGQIGQVAYAASKGGIVALTLPAARDLASIGIRVCAIAPGIMGTLKLTQLAPELIEKISSQVPQPPRAGRPEEFAELVLVIIDHEYLNGEVIRLDGALRMPPR